MHRYAQKPTASHELVSVGDVVLIYDEDHPRILWKLAKVESLLKGSDGAVRGARVRVRRGNGFTVLNRPVQHLYPLEVNVGDAGVLDHPKVCSSTLYCTSIKKLRGGCNMCKTLTCACTQNHSV